MNFQISNLFKDVYGITPSSYKVNPSEENEDVIAGVSVVGTPVYERLEILPGVSDYNGSSYDGLMLPDTIVITASRSKIIEKTIISGKHDFTVSNTGEAKKLSQGTVKELITLDDWQINIKGFIINYDNKDYPRREVNELRRICELPTSLEVVSEYLNGLGIDRIVIQAFNPLTIEGMDINVQAFEIIALSDEPIELEL